jgi:hypothetical protein
LLRVWAAGVAVSAAAVGRPGAPVLLHPECAAAVAAGLLRDVEKIEKETEL